MISACTMDSRMRVQGLSPGCGNIVVGLGKIIICFVSTDLRSQMEAQRGCSLTKAEKRVFLQVTASEPSKTTFSYITMDLAKYKVVVFSI